MSRLLYCLLGLSLSILIGSIAPVQAQGEGASEEESLSSHPISVPSPEAIVARKTVLQARLEALGPPLPDGDSHTELRVLLEQLLTALSSVEEGLSKQATFTAQSEEFAQRLAKLTTKSERLETRRPKAFDNPTDQLRDEYQTKFHAAQTKVQDVLKETAAGEVRLISIPREIEQHEKMRLQLENAREADRPSTPLTEEQKLQLELLDTRLQLELVTKASLEAERQWLLKRVPLQDLRLRVARLEQRRLGNELNTIKRGLGQAIEQEQTALVESAAEIHDRLQLNTEDPLESLLLGVSLENVEIRQDIVVARQQLNTLSDVLLDQEQHINRAKVLIGRLNTQAEKYASGEVAGQRVITLFERLRQLRSQYQDTTVTELEKRLRSLNERLFALDDELFDFDETIEARLAPFVTTQESDGRVGQIQALLTEQKAVLREQQQILSAVGQSLTSLIAAHREYRRELDAGYVSALTKLFWVRTAEPLSLGVIRQMSQGAVATFQRLSDFVHGELVSLKALPTFVAPLVIGLLGALLAAAIWARRVLRQKITRVLAGQTNDGQLPGREAFGLIVLRAAIWPTYILLLAWIPEVLGRTADPTVPVMVNGLLLSAGIVWLSLLSRGLLRRNGWAQSSWGLPPELCRSLQRSSYVLCGGLLVFIVPRYMVLAVSGEADTAGGGLAFARLLFMAFQLLVLILVGLLARRGSLLMQTVLARSREEDGLVWRLWPFVYAVLLLGLSSILGLDIFGYRYAALYIWLRTVESLSVILVVRGLVVALVVYVLQRLVDVLLRASRPSGAAKRDARGRSDDLAGVRFVAKTVLTICAVGIILEIWGFPVRWLITGETAIQLASRAAIIGLAVLGALVAVQLSKVLTSYLLQPRANWRGQRREAGRQLRTLVPLVQAVISVMVVFVTGLLILDQVGVDTGPILAGVGIFGLAVGFASQSLIKDVINGLFILFEDSISLGDIVELRGVTGEVEKFTLRAVTLRDLSGNVHVIPNSSFDMVTNMTKTFSRYMLDVGIAYRENVDEVIEILKEIDAGMRADAEYSRLILEPIEILGLDRFEDSAVVIRARLTTQPIKQWQVGREFKRRMKATFDARGIEIPFPHQTIYWGQPKEGAPLPLHIATSRSSPH